MKTRKVVGPPPIKYLKKYANGGMLKKYPAGETLAEDTTKVATGTEVKLGKQLGTEAPSTTSKSTTPSYSGSFSSAFAKARKELGANKVFSYNGKLFTTNYAEEAASKPVSQGKGTSTVTKPIPPNSRSLDFVPSDMLMSSKTNTGSITKPAPKKDKVATLKSNPDIQKLKQNNYWPLTNQASKTPTVVEKKPATRPISNVVNKPVTTASTKPEPVRRDTILKANEDDKWIRTIMEFEASKGSKEGKGLPNFGYNNKSTAPKNIDEAVTAYKREYLPRVANLPKGVRERFGDFLYNSGENLWLYMSHVNRLNKGEQGVENRSMYRVNGRPDNKPGERSKYIEKDFAKDISEISKLPVSEQIKLADQARDYYYKNIETVKGKPNPAYDKTWKYRVNMFNNTEEKPAPKLVPSKDKVTTLKSNPKATKQLEDYNTFREQLAETIKTKPNFVSGKVTPDQALDALVEIATFSSLT